MHAQRVSFGSKRKALVSVHIVKFIFHSVREMFPKVPPLSLLERKIDRHMKDNDDKLKLFKSELEILKSSSKRPSTVATKARAKQPEAAQKAVTITTAKSKGDEKKSVSTSTTPKASKKAVNFFRQLGAFPRSSILIASPIPPVCATSS